MPEFLCRLGAADGSIIEQRRVAAAQESLRHELEGEGFHVFAITGAGVGTRLPFFSREKVSGQEFLLFNTQLATLLHAGLPLTQGLDLLKDQQSSPQFRGLLNKIHQQVTTGISLSDAFLSLGDVFPRLYANSLRAGERSGELENVLRRYVEYQRLVESVRRKIISALTYPAVLILMSLSLVILLMVRVIPTFTSFYEGMGSELPAITRAVVFTAETTKDHFLLMLGSTFAGIFFLRMWSRTPTGARLTGRWKLHLPVIGGLAHLFSLSQFSRSLAVLLGGGTPMVPALETAATSVSNAFVSERFMTCVSQVREGRALSDALESTGLAPNLSLAMIRVGESTGALPEMLNHTSEFFDEEIDFSLNRAVTLFEPAILVVMGVIVGGLLLSVYYPLLNLISRIQ